MVGNGTWLWVDGGHTCSFAYQLLLDFFEALGRPECRAEQQRRGALKNSADEDGFLQDEMAFVHNDERLPYDTQIYFEELSMGHTVYAT